MGTMFSDAKMELILEIASSFEILLSLLLELLLRPSILLPSPLAEALSAPETPALLLLAELPEPFEPEPSFGSPIVPVSCHRNFDEVSGNKQQQTETEGGNDSEEFDSCSEEEKGLELERPEWPEEPVSIFLLNDETLRIVATFLCALDLRSLESCETVFTS